MPCRCFLSNSLASHAHDHTRYASTLIQLQASAQTAQMMTTRHMTGPKVTKEGSCSMPRPFAPAMTCLSPTINSLITNAYAAIA